jgi:hypothetical protein
MGSSVLNACTSGSTPFNWKGAQNFSINLNPDQFNDPDRDRFAVVRLTQSRECGSWLRDGTNTSARLSVTLATPPCEADLNDNGVVNSGDPGFLIAAWGQKGHAADPDGNGLVDSGDLGIMLGEWGPCPRP